MALLTILGLCVLLLPGILLARERPDDLGTGHTLFLGDQDPLNMKAVLYRR